jgi:hypothetical protein
MKDMTHLGCSVVSGMVHEYTMKHPSSLKGLRGVSKRLDVEDQLVRDYLLPKDVISPDPVAL